MSGSDLEDRIVRFGDFELNLRSGELRKGGARIPLQDQPFRVLARLTAQPGQVVTREELREQLWPSDTHVDFEHGVNAAVRRLREALGDSAETPTFIETLPRRGYRFIAPVQSQADPPATVRPASAPIRRWPLAAALTIAGALVAVLASGPWIGRVRPLGEGDRVLIADFVNRTGDPVFDDTLTRALAVKLEESPYLGVVPDQRLHETLQLMNRPPDERVTPSVGREVCVRQGAKAMIAGDIVRIGDRYALSLSAIDCATGDVIARALGEAPKKEAVLDALGRAGATLREHLGERLSSIQRLDQPLSEATTASLDALKAFSLGEQHRSRGRPNEAFPFYRRAIELDPDFALAYARLALMYGSTFPAAAAESATAAFQRADRVSERERLYILEAYHMHVSFDQDQRRDAIEVWVRTYPGDARAVQRLAQQHIARGECDKGLEQAREQMRLEPDAFAYVTLANAHYCLGQLADAKRVAERALAQDFYLPRLHALLYRTAFAEGDAAGMQRQVEWSTGRFGEFFFRWERAFLAAVLGQFGRVRLHAQNAVAMAQADGLPHHAGTIAARAAILEALVGHRKQARERAAAAIATSRDKNTLLWAGIALGLAREDRIAYELPAGDYPLLPVSWARAAAELGSGRPARSLEVLRAAARHEPEEGTPFSQYLRGEAYLQLGSASDAAGEFEKLTGSAPGSLPIPFSDDDWKPLLGAVAHARLGHAYALAGDIDRARASYARFFELWHDADSDLPLVRSARAERAALLAGHDGNGETGGNP